ncbi:MAG: DUF1963 domain-containing protein [Clostridia bacterium]|nr:DUF1963 domain-containing protein [Clostridia bacterium]
MAIGIRLKKAEEGYDPSRSKFFGDPTVPQGWEESFSEDTFFLCQINLEDLASFEEAKVLPDKGYLYIFLDTEEGDYDLRPDVRYTAEDPEVIYDDFNGEVVDYEKFTEAYLMEFYETDDDADGIRLFGVPSDWNYESEAPKMLLQYDPLDNESGFLDHLDGFLYFFFGKDERDFDAITLMEEYS